jgi:hypothetical protein
VPLSIPQHFWPPPQQFDTDVSALVCLLTRLQAPCGSDRHSTSGCQACISKVSIKLIPIARALLLPGCHSFLSPHVQPGTTMLLVKCVFFIALQAPFPACDQLQHLLQQACSVPGVARMADGSSAAEAAKTLLPVSGCTQCWQHCTRCIVRLSAAAHSLLIPAARACSFQPLGSPAQLGPCKTPHQLACKQLLNRTASIWLFMAAQQARTTW